MCPKTISAEERLAERYSISLTHARFFIDGVISQLRNKPEREDIADFVLKLSWHGKISTETIARKMSNARREQDVARLKRALSNSAPSPREFIRPTQIDKREYASRMTDIIRHSPLDQERVSEKDLAKCEHGVPIGKRCGICNAIEFHEETGID